MEEKWICTHCGEEMKLFKQDYLKFGGTGLLLGTREDLAIDELWVNVMGCSNCGKIEIVCPELLPPKVTKEEKWSKTRCPHCHERYDKELKACPNCGFKML